MIACSFAHATSNKQIIVSAPLDIILAVTSLSELMIIHQIKQTSNQKQDEAVRTYIFGRAVNGQERRLEDTQTWLGCCRTSAINKKRNPDTITLSELRRAARVLSVTGRELCEMVGAKYD